MLKKLAGLAVVACLFFAGSAFAQTLSGTAHDFSDGAGFGSDTWNTSGEVCKVCHNTHNTDTTVATAPLWNHETSTATYTVYTGFDMQATSGVPSGTSALCMSCHDGSVALDSFGGATGGTNLTGGALVGTDLSDDHPIGFTYDDTLAGSDGELQLPGSTPAVAALLDNGAVQCSSCHDVHGTPNDSLLVIDNAGSALCNTCHIK